MVEQHKDTIRYYPYDEEEDEIDDRFEESIKSDSQDSSSSIPELVAVSCYYVICVIIIFGAIGFLLSKLR